MTHLKLQVTLEIFTAVNFKFNEVLQKFLLDGFEALIEPQAEALVDEVGR